MKRGNYFLGIEETPFSKTKFIAHKRANNISKNDMRTRIIGAISRGGERLEGVISCEITIDGDDGTDEIIKMIRESKYSQQIKGIFLKGISIGGFNTLDITKMYQILKIPIVVCSRKEPDMEKIEKALQVINMSDKFIFYENAGEVRHYINENNDVLFLQFKGIEGKDLKTILQIVSTHCVFPEPLRLAKLIAQGIGSDIQEKLNNLD